METIYRPADEARAMLDMALCEAGYTGRYKLLSPHDASAVAPYLRDKFFSTPEMIGVHSLDVPPEIIYRAMRLVYPEITPECFKCWKNDITEDPCTHQ